MRLVRVGKSLCVLWIVRLGTLSLCWRRTWRDTQTGRRNKTRVKRDNTCGSFLCWRECLDYWSFNYLYAKAESKPWIFWELNSSCRPPTPFRTGSPYWIWPPCISHFNSSSSLKELTAQVCPTEFQTKSSLSCKSCTSCYISILQQHHQVEQPQFTLNGSLR